jgi:arylsulfatase A-like enzyme
MKPSCSVGLLVGGALVLGSFSAGWSGDEALPRPDAEFKGKIATKREESVPYWPEAFKAPSGAPNVVLVLLDDIGFGDTSVMGGAIQTPVLEKLAAQGLRYNRFHVCAMSSPTRASLLTGRNHHQVGFGGISEFSAGYPGYNSVWPENTVSLPEVLRQNGYSTAAFGKWHNTPVWEISPTGPFDHWPTSLGFEYFYGFMGGATSQWKPRLYRNTLAVEPPATPQQGYHLTTDLANEAIQWIHQHESLASDKPFFLYFATGAAHAPHHVSKEWIAKYKGRFDEGWDKLREETFARQKKLGIIPADADLTLRPPELSAWDSLTPDQKKLMAHQAEVYAGFVAQTDYEVGRILQAIAGEGKSDNTIVFYIVGDNGASGEGGPEGYDNGGPYGNSSSADVATRLRYYGDLGSEVFTNNYSVAWAWGFDSPFQWTKQVASHLGGTRNPLIISWPARIKSKGQIRSQFAHVSDIAPTIYEIAGVRFPDTVNGVKQLPLEGQSLVYTFDHPDAPSARTLQYFEMLGNRGIYKDGWWAGVRNQLPWDMAHLFDKMADHPWELYDLNHDYSQAHDLASKYPQKLKELQDAFDSEAKRNQVYPLVPAPGEGRPSPIKGKTTFTYYPGVTRLTSAVSPDLAGRTQRIVAVLDIPNAQTEGAIIAQGGRWGGFALYVKNNHLVCETDGFGPYHQKMTSYESLPTGKVEVAFEFTAEPLARPAPKDPVFNARNNAGTGRIFINGKPMGEARFTHFGPFTWETLDVGEDNGTPVSDSYSVPFAFTGTIEKVTVEQK